MFDSYSMLTTMVVAALVLASVSLVLSRIIPDEYDNRALARSRIEPGRPPRGR